MKIGIVNTHPTQFDVPIFRLGSRYIEVIYTDINRIQEVYDKELEKSVTWMSNNLQGYHYEVVPKKAGISWLIDKIRKANYDLLIVNGYYNKYLISSIIAGKLWSKKNALRLDTVEYNNTGLFSRIYKKVLYVVLRYFVDSFFVVSTLSRNFLLNLGINPKRILFYGYISDNDFFSRSLDETSDNKTTLRSTLNIPESRRIILCISKHNPREAPFDTLEAFRIIHNEHLHLLLVGDGPMHLQLKNRAAELGIKNISFAGYVHFSLLPSYYSIADVFVHDSHDEPWGVSVQEAIACGLPVVASDRVGASYDLIVDDRNGYMFKHGNINELANRVTRSLSLDRKSLLETNTAVLKEWNYEKTLQNILTAL